MMRHTTTTTGNKCVKVLQFRDPVHNKINIIKYQKMKYFTKKPYFLFADLGDGWVPVVLNSATELIFIKEIQKELNDNHSYWIGGSTDIEAEGSVTFLDYLQDNAGNDIFPDFTTKI